MKIINGFTLRSIAGENIVGGESVAQINFNKLISLNDSAAYLWREVEGRDFSVETLSYLLVEKYGITAELATTDSTNVLNSWIEAGLVEQ